MNKIGCFDRQEVRGYPLPGLLLGFSLGNSIHLSLYILSLAAGAGWLKLAQVLDLPKTSLQLLAFLLAMTSSLGSLSLSTASVFTSATFPWLLIWSLHLSELWNLPVRNFKIHLLSILFFLTIGIHAFFKLSSLLDRLCNCPHSLSLSLCKIQENSNNNHC